MNVINIFKSRLLALPGHMVLRTFVLLTQFYNGSAQALLERRD